MPEFRRLARDEPVHRAGHRPRCVLGRARDHPDPGRAGGDRRNGSPPVTLGIRPERWSVNPDGSDDSIPGPGRRHVRGAGGRTRSSTAPSPESSGSVRRHGSADRSGRTPSSSGPPGGRGRRGGG
ncbi:hypothetical protein HBB16_12400 [Pseudonocardia sp. MCCB 268]|nr:hypothetical protein [Pseudonocardia cytotoxica]